jgi:integrase
MPKHDGWLMLARLPHGIVAPGARATDPGQPRDSYFTPVQLSNSLDPHSTKNDEPPVFPLTAELRALPEQQRAEIDRVQKETGTIVRHVFHRHGKPIKSFRRIWKTACKPAGLPGRIPHDMRRSGVRNMIRAGIPKRVCMALAGHKTRSVFERYTMVSAGDLLDAAAELDAAVTAAVTKTVTPAVDKTAARR